MSLFWSEAHQLQWVYPIDAHNLFTLSLYKYHCQWVATEHVDTFISRTQVSKNIIESNVKTLYVVSDYIRAIFWLSYGKRSSKFCEQSHNRGNVIQIDSQFTTRRHQQAELQYKHRYNVIPFDRVIRLNKPTGKL